jgi:hypothetical protein
MYKYLDLSVHKQTDSLIHTYNRQTKPIKAYSGKHGARGGGGLIFRPPPLFVQITVLYKNKQSTTVNIFMYFPPRAAAIKTWADLTLSVTVSKLVYGVWLTSTCVNCYIYIM